MRGISAEEDDPVNSAAFPALQLEERYHNKYRLKRLDRNRGGARGEAVRLNRERWRDGETDRLTRRDHEKRDSNREKRAP